MENIEFAVQIAQFLSIFYLAYAIGGLMNKDYFKKIIDGLMKSMSEMMALGFVLILFGIVIVQNHNIWVWDWTVLVTIVGWASLLKWVSFVAFPEMFAKMSKKMLTKGMLSAAPILSLVLWLLFGYFGFIMS